MAFNNLSSAQMGIILNTSYGFSFLNDLTYCHNSYLSLDFLSQEDITQEY